MKGIKLSLLMVAVILLTYPTVYANNGIDYDIDSIISVEESVLDDTNIDNVDEQITTEMEIPNIDSSFKAFMDYRTITSKTSMQYKLQQDAYTDYDGFRRLYGNYMIAVGTYYAQECGTMLKIKFEDDTILNCIVGDIKSDMDTDGRNQHRNGNIVEFIVDDDIISDECEYRGDMSYTGIYGNVISIEKYIE